MAITISGENNNDKILASDGVIDQISGFSIVGVVTATSFTGDLIGNVTGNLTGNVNSTSPLLLQTGGSERFRITGNNELGIAGANYGSAGQVLTSGGSGSAVSWTTPAAQTSIVNYADNKLVTATGSGTSLNAEANLTFDGAKLTVTSASKDLLYLNSTHSDGPQISIQTSGTTFSYIGSAASLFSTGSSTDLGFRAESGKHFLFGIGSSEKVRITSDGKVGINQSSPSAMLQVDYDEGNSQIGLRLRAYNASGSKTWQLSEINGNAGVFTIRNATNSVNALSIDSNGNIGINDTAPPNFTGYKSLSIHGSTGGALVFGDDGTDEWEIYGGDAVLKIYDRANTVERFRLDGAYGRFGINTTSFVDTSTALAIRNGRSDSDHTMVDIISNDNETVRIMFSEDSNHGKGQIRYTYTGDGNYMSFYTNGNATGNERLRITSGGRMLGGNHLNDRGAVLQIESSEHNMLGLHRNTADHGAPAMTFSASRGTSAGSNTIVQSGDYLGLIRFSGTDGVNLASGAQITAIVDGTPGENDMPARLGFWTTPDGSQTPDERLRIQANGEIGINVDDPDSYGQNGHGYRGLTVQAPAGGYSGITIRSNYAGGGILAFADGSGSNAELKNIALQADHVNKRLDIMVNGSPKVRFTENGFHPNPSDTAAANALDDYEEGSWTPTIYRSNNSGVSGSYNHQEGSYVRVGRLVFALFRVDITSFSGGSGHVAMGGLPFNTNSHGVGGWTNVANMRRMYLDGDYARGVDARSLVGASGISYLYLMNLDDDQWDYGNYSRILFDGYITYQTS